MSKKNLKIILQDDGQEEQTTADEGEEISGDGFETTWYDPRFRDTNGNSYFAFNMQGLLFWNYYVTYLSLFTHIIIHALLLGMWCSYSKIVILYSIQVFCLHAFSWAIPDRRYAEWVQGKSNWFYFCSTLNIIFFAMGMFGGSYLYANSKDGILQFTGISCVAYTFLSQSLMMLMFTVNYHTLSTRFQYQEAGYKGHVDYPKKETEMPDVKANLLV